MEVGQKVHVHYTGTLDDGTVFDTSVDKEPLEFEAGTGQVIEGFDKAVLGMEVGEKKSLHIPCAEAYGEHDPEKIVPVKKDEFPNADTVPIGKPIVVHGPGGIVAPVVVNEVDDDYVYVDFNNRLAGKDLNFDIELLELVD